MLEEAGYSINYGSIGKDGFPIVGKPEYGPDGTTLKLNVKLLPEHEYSFVLTSLSFATVDGFPLKNYTVEFGTRK